MFKTDDKVVISSVRPNWGFWNGQMTPWLGVVGVVRDISLLGDREARVQVWSEEFQDSWYFPLDCVTLADDYTPEEAEYTGGSVSYYTVHIEKPTTEGVDPYDAECNDIIEALDMNYAEGNAFKAIWRRCAARKGKAKKGYTDGLYDAQKVVFFGQRMVAQEEE